LDVEEVEGLEMERNYCLKMDMDTDMGMDMDMGTGEDYEWQLNKNVTSIDLKD
jgi:hypothetical protein